MATKGTCIPPHVLRQCWPTLRDGISEQDLEGIMEVIVCRLDEVAMHHPSTTAWDRFAFPQTNQKYWQEEVLSHYAGKVLNISVHMPGFQLMLQNEDRWYGNATHALKFEGSMFIYDPQRDISQWVLVWGVSISLTMVELRSANDHNNMNPSPYDGTELIQPHSPCWWKEYQWELNQIWTALMNMTLERSGIRGNVAIGRIVPFCLQERVLHGWRPM